MLKKTKSRAGDSKSRGNATTNQRSGKNNQKKVQTTGTRKAEFKFQLHDPQRRGTYTYDRILEAIILKIQKEFDSSRHIVNSLRSRKKSGPQEPTVWISNKVDQNERVVEQASFNRAFDISCARYHDQNEKFEENWVRAYGMIFDNYCSYEIRTALKEHKDFSTIIQDDPLELLIEVEKLTHVSRKASYPILMLVEALFNLNHLKQGDKEGLGSYLERFQSERNVYETMFGSGLLDTYVERTEEYKNLHSQDPDQLIVLQKKMKEQTLDKFFGIMFLKQSNQFQYGDLLRDWRQSYANGQRDLYPNGLKSMFEVMKTVERQKKKKTDIPIRPPPKGDTEVANGAASFLQDNKKKKVLCHVCGKEGEYAGDCKLRTKIPEEKWYKNTGIKHYLGKNLNQDTEPEEEETKSGTNSFVRQVGFVGGHRVGTNSFIQHIGFVNNQKTHQIEEEEPDILLDSGSTISLFKDRIFLNRVWSPRAKLLMETNAGSKVMKLKGEIEGFGEVWFDEEAVSNLMALCDLVRRGHRVTYDSDVEDAFVVHVRDAKGRILRQIYFKANNKGLYVKQKESEMLLEGGNKLRDEEESPSTERWCGNQEAQANVEGFTAREVERAKACRRLMHNVSAPSYADLNKMLRMNLIKNCPVGCEDIVLAEKIFGKDVSVLKGKSVRPRPKVVTREDMIDLPKELTIVETELAIDVIYVDSEAFLHAIDRKIKGKALVPLGTMQKAKAADLIKGLKAIIKEYNRLGVKITMIHADNEFRSIEQEVDDNFEIPFNFSNPDEHVGDIERSNRVLEERFRTEYHHLPYLLLPVQMIRELLARITKNRCMVIAKGGCSAYYSPHQILKKRNVDYEKEFRYSFGSYVIASEKTTNTPKARGRDCIYLRASRNLQGGHRVLDITTGRVLERAKVTEVPITDLVVAAVERMAKEQGLTSHKFYNRKKEVTSSIDLLEGVKDETTTKERDQSNLPSQGDGPSGELLSEDDDDTLDGMEEIDENEVAEFLDD